MNGVRETPEFQDRVRRLRAASKVTDTPYGMFIIGASMWLALLLGPVALLNLTLLYLVVSQ